MLNTDPQRFTDLGYCLFPDVLDPQETVALRQMLDEAMASPLPHFAEAHRQNPGALDRKGYVGEPHARDLRWLEICRHPRVLDAVESILGPNLILVFSSVFIKLPRDPTEVAWHQDNTYWPNVHGTDVATLWLAVDDADAANAAMQVIPGSHQGYEELEMIPSGENQSLRATVAIAPEQEATAVTLAMSAGNLSIHDSFILPGSGANTSDRRRAGYTIRYCSTDTAWVDTEAHPIPVFLVRGEAGARGAGYVDLRPAIEPTPDIFSQRHRIVLQCGAGSA